MTQQEKRSSGWHHYTKPQHENRQKSRSMWPTSGCHMRLRFRYLWHWKSLGDICECFAKPSVYLSMKNWSVPLSSRAKIISEDREQRGANTYEGLQRRQSFCLRGLANYAIHFQIDFVVFCIFKCVMMYHSIFLPLLSLSKYLERCKQMSGYWHTATEATGKLPQVTVSD